MAATLLEAELSGLPELFIKRSFKPVLTSYCRRVLPRFVDEIIIE
jgi:hypothetical protein